MKFWVCRDQQGLWTSTIKPVFNREHQIYLSDEFIGGVLTPAFTEIPMNRARQFEIKTVQKRKVGP